MKSIVKFMGFVSVLALAVSCSQPSIDDEDVLSYGSETTATSEATNTNPTNGGGQTSTDVEEGNHGTTTTEHQPYYEMDCDLNGATDMRQYAVFIDGERIATPNDWTGNSGYMLENSVHLKIRISVVNGNLHAEVPINSNGNRWSYTDNNGNRHYYEIQNVIKNGDSIYITTAQLR